VHCNVEAIITTVKSFETEILWIENKHSFLSNIINENQSERKEKQRAFAPKLA
jgi:hypothetical protein